MYKQLIVLSFYQLLLSHFSNTVQFDLERLCVDQILDAISSNTSCVEITTYFLHRIRKYNSKINAVITVDDVSALRRAEKLDNYYSNKFKVVGPLHCVPTLVKDNILVKRLPMTLGLEILANSTASVDAPAVKRLRKAGAIILGKANMSPMSLGWPEDPSLIGRVWNPYSLNVSASSSSGGNAAGLAARLSVIGLSSDTTGSTSAPASVTYSVGLRPPTRSFNMSGLFPLGGPDYDTIGVMALTVKDTRTVLDVLSSNRNRSYKISSQNQSWPDQFSVRVGIIGNLTYSPLFSTNGEYVVDKTVRSAFQKFENNLKTVRNINVTVYWDQEVMARFASEVVDGNPSLYYCVNSWISQFMEKYEMFASGHIRLTSLMDLDAIVTETGVDTEQSLGWRRTLADCILRADLCNSTRAQDLEQLRIKQDFVRETLLNKFDVIVFTMNPHSLISSPRLDSEDGYLVDVASMFAFPSLVIPIGFSTGTKGERSPPLPVSAYFMTSPEKFQLMMNVAKSYENLFWAPKMPANFN